MAVLREKSGAATLFALALCLALSGDAIGDAMRKGARLYLVGQDFSAWRQNTGQWKVVGDTFMNPTNERLLASRPGTGVFVNGPTGRTSHLFSKEEFGDAKFEKVIHNGIVVHEDVNLSGPTRAAAYNDEKHTGPLMLQGDHGPVAYRNIWLGPADSWYFYAFGNALRGKGLRLREQVTLLKELGYDGMEYSGCRGLEEILEELDNQGLRLFALYIGVQLDSDKQSYDPGLKNAIRLLKGRDTVLAVNVRGRKLPRSSREADGRAVRIVREIADMARESGLRVALYPHYGFWLERVEHAVRIVKKVDRENVGVVFNLCHWLRTESGKNMHHALQVAKPHLFLVSINGADHDGGWDELIQPLDSGEYDVYPVLKTLKELGYTGPIGLQCYGIQAKPREHLARSMKAWWQLNRRLQTDEN